MFFFFFFFVFLSFEARTHGIRRFPGYGSNRSCSCWSSPQLQQRQIWASSATYTTAHGNTGSLTYWARLGMEPATSWFLVGFVPAVPRWELPWIILNKLYSGYGEEDILYAKIDYTWVMTDISLSARFSVFFLWMMLTKCKNVCILVFPLSVIHKTTCLLFLSLDWGEYSWYDSNSSSHQLYTLGYL